MEYLRTSVRIPVEIGEKIKKMAEEEDRSIHYIIIRILKEYFKDK